MTTITELLDSVEAPLTTYLQSLLATADVLVTREEAKNLLGKIGTRITFGKEQVDRALTKK